MKIVTTKVMADYSLIINALGEEGLIQIVRPLHKIVKCLKIINFGKFPLCADDFSKI